MDKVQLSDENSTVNSSNEGFFAENFKSILKSRAQIDSVVEEIERDGRLHDKKIRKHKHALQEFLQEL